MRYGPHDFYGQPAGNPTRPTLKSYDQRSLLDYRTALLCDAGDALDQTRCFHDDAKPPQDGDVFGLYKYLAAQKQASNTRQTLKTCLMNDYDENRSVLFNYGRATYRLKGEYTTIEVTNHVAAQTTKLALEAFKDIRTSFARAWPKTDAPAPKG